MSQWYVRNPSAWIVAAGGGGIPLPGVPVGMCVCVRMLTGGSPPPKVGAGGGTLVRACVCVGRDN